jgi:peptide deformylase
MALRQLTNWHDPLFRKKSRPVEKFDERLWTLLDDMKDTLEAVKGFGCAAVHVGVLRRVVVIKTITVHSKYMELVNPVITEMSTETQNVQEGSIAPDSPHGTVTRPMSITVSALDRNGNPKTVTLSEFLAATLLHEIDHLDGMLFTDKMD